MAKGRNEGDVSKKEEVYIDAETSEVKKREVDGKELKKVRRTIFDLLADPNAGKVVIKFIDILLDFLSD